MKDPRLYRDEITAQVDRILDHALFKGAKRSRSFLKYVSTQVLNGESYKIKEFSIAVDAFGLETTFDQQIDPRIRVEAKRLRDRLNQYYEGPGKHDPIHIDIPKGSYIPEFSFNSKTDKESAEPSSGTGESLSILIDRRFDVTICFFTPGFTDDDSAVRTFQSHLVHQLFNLAGTGTASVSLSEMISIQKNALPLNLEFHMIREQDSILLNIRIKMKPAGMLIQDRFEHLAEEDLTTGETSLCRAVQIVESLLDFFRSLK